MFGILFDICYYANFVLIPIIIFVFFSRDDNFHSTGGLLYFIKLFFGRRAIKKQQQKLRNSKRFTNLESIEEAKCIRDKSQTDTLSFFAVDQNQNQLRVKFTLRANHIAELFLCLRINGNIYVLPNENDATSEERLVSCKSITKYAWKCQGLNVEILEPLKRCRLTFNGFLTNVSAKSSDHVKFNFIWNCSSKPNFSWLDDDLNLLTKCLAKTKWGNGKWLDHLGDEKGYVQFGSLRGLVSGANISETELNMASAKKRFWGSLESEKVARSLTIFAATENGHLMHFGVKSIQKGCAELKFGHIQLYTGHVLPIQNSDLEVNKIDQNVSDEFTMHVKVAGKVMKITISIDKNSTVNFSSENFQGYKCSNFLTQCGINSNTGMAILEHWWCHKGNGMRRPPPLLKEIKIENVPQIYVTPIGSEESKILQLSGGKGCSLGLMKSYKEYKFVIPDGFIVTTCAFQQQAENNFHLRKAVTLLEDIAFGREQGNLEKACEETVKLFEQQTMMPSIAQSILDQLMKFRKNHNNEILPFLRWAVRSSAIGEDSEDFSSAGQNATFLGCQTDVEVLDKVTRCWASLYSHQSVTYRRQHGLPIRTSMAVVVQKIIPADSAGVLFTCHPSDCNPAKMVITSNFGLGETVVSGEAEPDTIILSRDFKGTVTIHSYSLGSKKQSILIGKYGLHKSTVRLEQSTRLSLSKENALELGKLGVLLENAYGSPRDIEWAVFQDEIYILQSRPVTTCNRWTDYELLHELDSPHVSNDIFYTKANIGEVSPFAMTPLTQTAIMERIEQSCQLRMFGFYDPYVSKAILTSHHHAMLELLGCLHGRPKKKIEISAKLIDIAIFGRIVLNEDINQKALARYGVASNLKNMVELRFLLTSNSILKKMMREIEIINIDIGQKDTPEEILAKIEKFLEQFIGISANHAMVSSVSVMYQTFAMICLMEGSEDITSEHYNDLALIVSCCEDVVSAEVPKMLENIADSLRTSNLADDFVALPPEQGVEWMKSNCLEASEHFQNFLKIHGHRLLGEMELSLNSWEMEPETVIKMIQANCKVKTKRSKKGAQIDVVDKLVSPKKALTRKILRFLINKQRKAVGNREQSKSVMVKAVNKIRIAFRTLAVEMTKKGLLPSPNLIFHLTLYELRQIIHKKNSNLISKAMRRNKLYPVWNKYKFAEIINELPVPEVENSINRENLNSDVICKGTPVCAGEVTARACVITSLDEIHLLQEGDVLITRSTDIGWSPYFPILSGIVTELGGLVSHGAVVAREYGLICIVGAKKATNLFKTGDMVYLSGKDGILQLCQNNT